MPLLASALMGFLLFSGAVAAVNPATAVSATSTAPAASAGFSVHLTGYNAVPAQTKPDPSTTADGGPSNPAVVAARSQDLAQELPFGTIIALEAPSDTNDCGYSVVAPIIGYRVITDTMNAKMKDGVDVLFDTKQNYLLADGRTVNASWVLGSCDNVIVRVVGHIDLSNPANLPQSQSQLEALVESNNLALQ